MRVGHLPPELRRRRELNLNRLRDYWTRGSFPKNTHFVHERAPYFKDQFGTPCAVAYLMERSGRADLVDDVARASNHVYIGELEGGPVIDWIHQSGLTKGEAARIQPAYCFQYWHPGCPPIAPAPVSSSWHSAIQVIPLIIGSVELVLLVWMTYRLNSLLSSGRTGRRSWLARAVAWLTRGKKSLNEQPRPSAAWTLEFGVPGEDDVIDPLALARGVGSASFVILQDHEVDAVDDGSWPWVSGDRVVWAVGKEELDLSPVALVPPFRAGDTSLLVDVAAALETERPDLTIATPVPGAGLRSETEELPRPRVSPSGVEHYAS